MDLSINIDLSYSEFVLLIRGLEEYSYYANMHLVDYKKTPGEEKVIKDTIQNIHSLLNKIKQ